MSLAPPRSALHTAVWTDVSVLHYPRRCGGLNPVRALQSYRFQSQRHARLHEHQAILVASHHMYEEYRKHGIGPDRLHLVRYPLTESFGCAAPTPKAPGGRLLFVGRVGKLKGVAVLLRAVPRAADRLGRKLSVPLAGDGGELRKMQDLARTLPIETEFTGWVGAPEKLALMRAADLLVVPSLWPEPFGLVGIEAGSAGLPAAGFAVGGIPDWLIPGVTGELAPADPPTVEGLADAMVRALQDRDHYNNLCREAFNLSQQFTMQRHLTELEAI